MVPSSYGIYDLFSISHAGTVYKSLKTDGVVSFIVLLLYFVMVFIESSRKTMWASGWGGNIGKWMNQTTSR